MRILLSGGCQSGKGEQARRLIDKLAGSCNCCCLAIKEPNNDFHMVHWEGWTCEAVTSCKQLSHCFSQIHPNSAVLIDNITSLFSNEMFCQNDGDPNAAWRTAEELRCLGERCAHIVYLTDEVFCDAGRYDSKTEGFRKGLAQVNRILAEQCDTVIEMYYGFPLVYKGHQP